MIGGGNYMMNGNHYEWMTVFYSLLNSPSVTGVVMAVEVDGVEMEFE